MATHEGDIEEQQWPVVVYRKLQTRVEKMVSKANMDRTAVVNISPRTGCIVVKKLRLKLNLVPEKGSKRRGTLTRRGNKLFVSLQNPPRRKSFIFQFESVKACVSFSDSFVALNPATKPSTQSNGVAERMATQELSEQRRDVMSYVARLVHDQDFLSYVNKLEAALKSSPDGEQILEALGDSPLDETAVL